MKINLKPKHLKIVQIYFKMKKNFMKIFLKVNQIKNSKKKKN